MAALSTDLAVAVIGSGTMGTGIAQVAAQAGHPTLLYDMRDGAAEAAVRAIAADLAKRVARGRLSQAAADGVLARLQPAATLDALAPAGLVVEAVVEDLAVKHRLFQGLEAVVADDAILATNTSSLSVTAIAAALRLPGRCAGLHFFNPAQVMPLVEVVSGLATDPTIADRLMATAAAWGKSPVAVRSTPGFIVNRVARPFYAEGLRLLQEGAGTPATIDALLREAGGFRMGPFELTDLIGQDVNYAVTCAIHQAFFGDPRFAPSGVQRELVEAGRLGRKSGRGFYHYGDAAVPVAETMAAAPPPRQIAVQGDLGPAAALADRLEAAGLAVIREPGAGRLLVDGVPLALTDGRCATARGVPVFDLALDYAKASRLAVAFPDQAPAPFAPTVAGLFQAAGIAVSRLDDCPGLAVMRTVAMLANEAAETWLHRVASAADIDQAMRLGTNYPLGPLAWAERIGLARVVTVLDHLAQAYGEDRYRASVALRRAGLSGRGFAHVG